MKIETTQKEDISDIARRVDNIELGIANIDHEVGEQVNLLTSSENDAQNIPDRLDNISDGLNAIAVSVAHSRKESSGFFVIWMLMLVAILLGFILWRLW